MRIYRGEYRSTAREIGLKENRNRSQTELLWKVLEERKNNGDKSKIENNRMPHMLRYFRILNEDWLL